MEAALLAGTFLLWFVDGLPGASVTRRHSEEPTSEAPREPGRADEG
jgi:hypothetical protein